MRRSAPALGAAPAPGAASAPDPHRGPVARHAAPAVGPRPAPGRATPAAGAAPSAARPPAPRGAHGPPPGVRLRAAALLALLALALVPFPAAEASGHEVVVARIDGVVDRGTPFYIEDALEEAERRGVPLVIELNTPGGLVDATLEIDGTLAAASVPVLTYVGPGGGAFAASAGTFILLMGHPSGMADGSSIGSAQPIQVGPGGGAQNASQKVENFLIERIRSIAERTGRDPDVAEQYVTENLNQGAEAALSTGMVDVSASSLRGFLVAIDGMDARVDGGTVRLTTADAEVVRVRPGVVSDTVSLLSDPTLASILLLVGVYALIFGLANPGTYVPETIGAILLILGLIGLGLFGVTTAGFLLMLLAAVFFVAEVFTPTHGILTAAGVATLVLAVIFLIDDPLLPRPFVRQFQFIGYGMAVVSGGLVFAVVTVAMRSRHIPVGDRSVGDRGTVLDRIDPEGHVEMWGEVWDARASEAIEAGEPVHVVRREGMLLHVEPVGDEEE